MSRLDKINQFKAAVPPPAISIQEAGGVAPTPAAGNQENNAKITYANSGIAPTMTSNLEYRNGALQQMNESEFDANKERMNASDKEYWRQQFESHPESAYTVAQLMFASDETPDQKKKRERREQLGQVFSNLGNVIGNAANLYYTSKGAPYIDLNTSQKETNDRIQQIKDRRQALKDKTDMLLFNARLGDIQAAREGRIAAEKAKADKAKADADRAADLYKLNLKLQYDKSKDANKDKIEKDKLAEEVRKNKAAESIARQKAQNEADNGVNKVVDSAMGRDGFMYTRNTKMTELEAKQLVERSDIEDLTPFMVEEKDVFGNVVNRKVDWASAAAYALSNGDISGEELIARGFKRSGAYNHYNEQESGSKGSGKKGGGKTPPYRKAATQGKSGGKSKSAPYLK